MMNVNSRLWGAVFLFYGAIFFLMGFFGYRLTADGHQSAILCRSRVEHGKIGMQRNLMEESEEYLAKVLARYNWIKTDVAKTEPQRIIDSKKSNEDLPVWASSKEVGLVYCFPEGTNTGTLQTVISRFHENLTTGFFGVKEFSIDETEHWDKKLSEILVRERPLVLIGINVIRPGLAHSGLARPLGKAGIDVHLYFAAEERWQPVLLPRMIAGFSSSITAFHVRKQNYDGREMTEIVWTEKNGEDLTGLLQNMESLLKILQEVPELRTVKNL